MLRVNNIFNPIRFQGRLNRKNYFEGWYFKLVDQNRTNALALIPGISLTPGERHAFIQCIFAENHRTEYFQFDTETFSYTHKPFQIVIDGNIFSLDEIRLNLKSKKQHITGSVSFNNMVKYPRRLLAPGIMGWYSFVPGMECYHGIGSVYHRTNGALNFNGRILNLDDGTGYIEKDWGVSFPETWLWIHSNTFLQNKASFMLSIAKIPWQGKFFIGFIIFLWFNNEYFVFATWNRAKIVSASISDQDIHIVLKRASYVLKVTAARRDIGPLLAPKMGVMNRKIFESLNAEIEVTLERKNKLLFSDHGVCSGIELEENIIDYIQDFE